MGDTEFLRSAIENNTVNDAIAMIKEHYISLSVEAQKRMIFNEACSACQQTEGIIREQVQIMQDSGE